MAYKLIHFEQLNMYILTGMKTKNIILGLMIGATAFTACKNSEEETPQVNPADLNITELEVPNNFNFSTSNKVDIEISAFNNNNQALDGIYFEIYDGLPYHGAKLMTSGSPSNGYFNGHMATPKSNDEVYVRVVYFNYVSDQLVKIRNGKLKFNLADLFGKKSSKSQGVSPLSTGGVSSAKTVVNTTTFGWTLANMPTALANSLNTNIGGSGVDIDFKFSGNTNRFSTAAGFTAPTVSNALFSRSGANSLIWLQKLNNTSEEIVLSMVLSGTSSPDYLSFTLRDIDGNHGGSVGTASDYVNEYMEVVGYKNGNVVLPMLSAHDPAVLRVRNNRISGIVRVSNTSNNADVDVDFLSSVDSVRVKLGWYEQTPKSSGIGVSDITFGSFSVLPDCDVDGIPDAFDAYPCDATKAFNLYTPTESTYGTLGFEDLWPSQGDYDFNDLVVDYQSVLIADANNDVVELQLQLVLKAIGGSFHDGFGFEMPIPSSSVASVTGTDLRHGLVTLNANGTEAGQTNAVVMVFDDAYDHMTTSGGPFVNTLPSSNYVTPDTFNISVVFTSPISQSSLGVAPFNSFIFIDGDRGKELHLADYAPTDLVNTAYFGTGSDDSNPGAGRYYKTNNNLPFVVDIFNQLDYPNEKTSINAAYTHFNQWAAAGGSIFADWADNKTGYRNNSNIYSK